MCLLLTSGVSLLQSLFYFQMAFYLCDTCRLQIEEPVPGKTICMQCQIKEVEKMLRYLDEQEDNLKEEAWLTALKLSFTSPCKPTRLHFTTPSNEGNLIKEPLQSPMSSIELNPDLSVKP